MSEKAKPVQQTPIGSMQGTALEYLSKALQAGIGYAQVPPNSRLNLKQFAAVSDRSISPSVLKLVGAISTPWAQTIYLPPVRHETLTLGTWPLSFLSHDSKNVSYESVQQGGTNSRGCEANRPGSLLYVGVGQGDSPLDTRTSVGRLFSWILSQL